jgi:hypothetical protein
VFERHSLLRLCPVGAIVLWVVPIPFHRSAGFRYVGASRMATGFGRTTENIAAADAGPDGMQGWTAGKLGSGWAGVVAGR